MIILGTPKASELNDYIIVDGSLAFKLHQAGFIPKYSDDGCLYFKVNKKLKKYLDDLQKNVGR